MSLAIALLITAGLAVFVVSPLLAAEGSAIVPIDVTPRADLKRRRLVLYENIQDLEFEYKAGKIAPEDYERLRTGYTAEAAQLMLASQELESMTADEAFIEREVAARRARHKVQPAVEEYVCAKCGFENPVPVKFCGECGAAITPGKQTPKGK
jgi:hypothetical protein